MVDSKIPMKKVKQLLELPPDVKAKRAVQDTATYLANDNGSGMDTTISDYRKLLKITLSNFMMYRTIALDERLPTAIREFAKNINSSENSTNPFAPAQRKIIESFLESPEMTHTYLNNPQKRLPNFLGEIAHVLATPETAE